MVNNQFRYWLLTIPQHAYMPYLPPGILYLRGQLESGHTTGYLHWQLLAIFSRGVRLAKVKSLFGDTVHAEPSRSNAADDYVWKEDTRVAGTQFELGIRPMARNNPRDWDRVKAAAISGDLSTIPSDVFIQHYRSLRTISADYATPIAMQREIFVFWGPTGVGKSRRAWELAGPNAYPKDPNSKFWDGYRGAESVVMDEFRGLISISHILRWFDRYPVLVEIKGSATVLSATKIYVTSNMDPRTWYPDLDELTLNALLRRLNIVYCPINLY